MVSSLAWLLCACDNGASEPPKVQEIKSVPRPAAEPPPVAPPQPMSRPNRSKGQTLYVPVYSTLPRTAEHPEDPVSVVLSIRNTDLAHPMTVQKVAYYDTEGHSLEPVLTDPESLPPL